MSKIKAETKSKLFRNHIALVAAGTKAIAWALCWEHVGKSGESEFRVLCRVQAPGQPTSQGARSVHKSQAEAIKEQGKLIKALESKGWSVRAKRVRATDVFDANSLPVPPAAK